MKQSIDVHYIYSTNCPVEFNSVFTYSLPAGSISFWYRQVKVSKYNSRFICFSLKFYQFFTSYFDSLLLGTHTLMVVTSSWSIDPLWWCNVPLYPWKLPCSAVCSVRNSYSDSCFLSISVSMVYVSLALYG